MKNLNVTETYRRGRVSGVGVLTASELPALEFNGTLTSEYYEVKFDKTGLPGAILRHAPNLIAFVDLVQ